MHHHNTLHDHQHSHPHFNVPTLAHEVARRKAPIPDLRFEYSYLRSIRPYIRCHTRHSSVPTDKNPQERYGKAYEDGHHGNGWRHLERDDEDSEDTITVHWKGVLWITMRDQVVLPLIQGALWGLASYWIPSVIRACFRVRRMLKPHQEGKGVGWLRGWVQGLGLSPKSQQT
ncbi:hypothetical protein AMATHDRAFT_63384 [Amanita thiersii Skay4041]|uniref:Uncharacterized protein n=1 Tax=Amanita thiersii Skay4041 TaxID=703135 RepID=A0A2A9NM65_9AGAR|nr:hypothetical protein AMATHDRAFT_63384 [Amanita thiersii Skay4041]